MPIYCQAFHAVPEVKDPPLFNIQLQYTASLLDSPVREVRVLIYGQSISVQDWWKEVKAYFENTYPEVKFHFMNKAIGGFSSERLKLTAKNDVASFYPDLILFHDYGNEEDYEEIVRIIRSTTTADIAVQTDHMAVQNQEWHDRHSEVWLPELCRKYGLALLDIRKYWKLYLTFHDLQIRDLLRDGVHLNAHGNHVMAGIVKSYFRNLKYEGVPDRRVRTLEKGKDFSVRNGCIALPFTGNRIDIKSNTGSREGKIEIRVDRNGWAEGTGCYYYTRPVLPSTGSFLTRIGFLIAPDLSDGIDEQDWWLAVLSVDSLKQAIRFSLEGSITGNEGTGSSAEKFTSRSGKITILPEAWFTRRHEGDFSQYHWLRPGDVLQWKTINSCKTSAVLSGASFQTIFQGISNSSHQLKICGAGTAYIDAIRVYSPLLKDND